MFHPTTTKRRFLAVSLVCSLALGMLGGNVRAIESQSNTSGAESQLAINGMANAVIVLPNAASDLETYAADELRDHVELVSGAQLPIISQNLPGAALIAELSVTQIEADQIGYYPFSITLHNLTATGMALNIAQTGAVAGDPSVIIRGDTGLDGNITLSSGGRAVVNGLVYVENTGFAQREITVAVNNGTQTLASLPITVVGTGVSQPTTFIGNSGFTSAFGWRLGSGAVIDNTIGNGDASSLKVTGSAEPTYNFPLTLTSGNLYRLRFSAKSDGNAASVIAKLCDSDTEGAALPMSLYTEKALTSDWTVYDFYFTANISGSTGYDHSVLSLICSGNLWLDNLSLVNCGTVVNELNNPGFELGANANNNPTGWGFASAGFKDTTQAYTGTASLRLHRPATTTATALGEDNTLEMPNAHNSHYTLSFWAKAATENNALTLKLGTDFLGTFVLSDQWTRYEANFYANADQLDTYTGAKLVFSRASKTGEFTVYVDDISLADTSAAAAVAVPEAVPVTVPAQPELAAPESTGMTVIIATPDSYSALSSLFSDDIAFLEETVVSETEVYGSDGFAIRQQGGVIYIFGAEPRGALNGVYDFIEENLGVLWIRANDTVYEEMETIPVTTVNYREKSPFAIRGWNTPGTGTSGLGTCDPATDQMLSRNKFNHKYVPTYAHGNPHNVWNLQRPIGLDTISMGHNIVSWLRTSSTFDPTETDYWNQDAEGNLFNDPSNDGFQQVNYWSDKTVAVVAQGVIDFLDRYDGQLDNVGIGIGDTTNLQQYPEQTLAFEYAPGTFVQPTDPLYLSTVYFTFINRVAQIVGEEYPNVTINTISYNWTEPAPLCDIEDNVRIVFAPAQEDTTDPLNTTATSSNNSIFQHLESWKQKTRNIIIYNYYGCFAQSKLYPRPIGDRIQADLQYYAANGFVGMLPEGTTDHGASANNWAMNSLTYWLYAKLAWNPYENVDALIAEFCEKVYGDAADAMLEFYSLVEQAWVNANVDGFDIRYFYSLQKWYLDPITEDMEADMKAALTQAWALADDTAKERIRYIKDTFESITA